MNAPIVLANRTQRRIARITAIKPDEFTPEHLELLEHPTSPLRRSTVVMVVLMVASVVGWSCLAGIDTFAVALARVQSGGRSKVVQPVDAGKVEQVMVRNGDKVVAGQPLILLDPTLTSSQRDAAANKLDKLDGEIARRKLEIEAIAKGVPCCPTIAFPATVTPTTRAHENDILVADLGRIAASKAAVQGQIAQKGATKRRLLATLAARRGLLAVLQHRLDMKLQLVKMAVGKRTDVLDATQRLRQAETDVAYEQGQIAEADAAADALRKKSAADDSAFVDDQAQRLEDARRRRDRSEQDLAQASARLSHTKLLSPIDGTVQQLTVTTLGQVVRAGVPLLVVVPSDGDIEVEALVLNKDIGELAIGEDAVVKLDPFPFSEYGAMDGKVIRISHDAVDGSKLVPRDGETADGRPRADKGPGDQNLVFPVTVKLNKASILINRREMPLIPGMTASVEIRTGRRSVIDYLLRPVHEALSQAGHER